MRQVSYSNRMYFVKLPIFKTLTETIYNPFSYFKFESFDEWFRTDLARSLQQFPYYASLKNILDKELLAYMREQKLKQISGFNKRK